MFEALRGLRDAVAPESGNLGGGGVEGAAADPNQQQQQQSQADPDIDELWSAYKAGDPDVVEMIRAACGTTSGGTAASGSSGTAMKLPQKREEFIRVHAKLEMEKDTELVTKLASTVLEKSALIDDRVRFSVPGIDRTRAEQMQLIQQLVEANRDASRELEKCYVVAKRRRQDCRAFILQNTCSALGIEEEDE